MNPTTWHTPSDVLARYAVDPAGVDDPVAASVESHLMACARCRAELAAHADRDLLAASWDAVADVVDRPRPSLLERLLLRLGVRSGSARLAAATAGLQLSGVAAVAALTGIAVAVTNTADVAGPFLLVAPIAPLAAVALTFAPVTDPGGEAGLATPVAGAGLALRRAAAVLVLALVVLALGALAVPSLGSAPLAWVLPATALAVGSLAVGTWVRLELAIAGLASAWGIGVSLVRYLAGAGEPLAGTAPFTAAGQGVALALTVVAAAVLVSRADRYSTLEVRG